METRHNHILFKECLIYWPCLGFLKKFLYDTALTWPGGGGVVFKNISTGSGKFLVMNSPTYLDVKNTQPS